MKHLAFRRRTAEADPLAAFGSEAQAPLVPSESLPSERTRPVRLWVGAALFVLALGIAAAFGVRQWLAVPQLATVRIDTVPASAEILWQGVSRGRAPLTLELPPGVHVVHVKSGGQVIPLSLNLAAGSTSAQHVLFAPAPPPVEPVTTLSGNPPAPVAPAPARPVDPPAAAAGWLTITSSIQVRVLEAGQVVGSSELARIMLPAGAHDLEIVNDALGFRDRRKVTIAAGKVAPLRLELPRVTLSVNAVPWADVTVDGEHAGETPIGNYSVPIGVHEITFRHPELGERRRQITVGLKTPARLTEDFKKP